MSSSTKSPSIARQGRELVHAAKRIRRDATPDDFHDARVATRRLRSALRVLEESQADSARLRAAEMRRLGRRLGRVRDLDVLLARVNDFAVGGAEGSHDLTALSKDLRSRRASARRRVVRLLENGRLRKKLRVLAKELEASDEAIAGLGRSIVLARARRLLALATNPATASEEELHRYRIRVKRFRYTLELSVGGGRAAQLLDEAKRIQDQLGLLNDAFVAEAMVKSFVDSYPQHRNSAELSALAAACREGQVRRRADLPEPTTAFRATLAAFVAERESELEHGGPGLAAVRPARRGRGRAEAG